MSATFTSEFRHEFEVERERLLRRRFLWYTGVIIGFGVFSLAGIALGMLIAPREFARASNYLTLLLTLVSIVPFLAGFLYVFRTLLARERILRLVSTLIIVNGAIAILSGPPTLSMQVDEQLAAREASRREHEAAAAASARGLRDEAAAFEDAGEGDAADQPSEPFRISTNRGLHVTIDEEELGLLSPDHRARTLARAVVFGSSLGTIFMSHLLACLFLPWTPRESFRPIVPLLVLNALVTLWYIRLVPIGGTISILASPLVALPGLLICVWRQSRFKDRFTFKMLKGRYGEIRQELASARQIHEALFPTPLADGPVRFEYRYEPMRQIGGDYLFARRVNADSRRHPILHMAIVDVTGHGIGAALAVNRLYGEISRQFGQNPDASPGDILTGLNDYLHHTLATQSVYATAVCLRFDPNTGIVSWASAGHPPAFLRTIDGRIDRLDSTTLVLGACRGTDFTPNEQSCRFQPGDMLVLYTDGAIEARNNQGRMLGLRGLESIIAAVKPDLEGGYASAVLRAIDEHRFGPPEDDTLIVEVWRPIDFR